MTNSASTFVIVFSIVTSTAALLALQVRLLGRVLDSFRDEMALRLEIIEGRIGCAETALDRIEHELISPIRRPA